MIARRFYLLLSLILLGLGAAKSPAQEAPDFSATVRNPYEAVVPLQVRIFWGTNKFSLMAPRNLRMQADNFRRQVVFQGGEQRYQLLARVVYPSQSFTPETYRQWLLAVYPGGKIGEMTTFNADGNPGTAYDLQWQSGGGVVQSVRRGFVSTPAGDLEFGVMAPPEAFKSGQNALNALLLSFHINVPESALPAPKASAPL